MKIRENLILRKIGKDYIIIEPEKESVDMTKVYSLNETAVWIWQQVQGREFTKDEMVNLMIERYEIDRPSAEADVENLLKIMREQNLIEEDK